MMTKPDIWYVAFGPDKSVKSDTRATNGVRTTKTFKSEIDAKLFAREILAKGWTATAGTLMVSSFGYNSFKQLDAEGPVRFAKFLLVPAGFVLIALWPPQALMGIFGTYALSGPLAWLWKRLGRARRREVGESS